jgi:hypothetical protein
MIIIDSTQGTSRLSQFDFLVELFKRNPDITLYVVFTKFMNAKNDLETMGSPDLPTQDEVAGMDEEEYFEYYQQILKMLGETTYSSLKNGLSK